MTTFRGRLLATLRAVRGVLGVPGVMVVGSEVPNLLEPGGAATLAVSQDVDLLVPLARHVDVLARRRGARSRRFPQRRAMPSARTWPCSRFYLRGPGFPIRRRSASG
jgi:hypothetical protein